MSPTRREMLEAGWKVGSGLLVVAAGWTSFEALKPLADVGGGGLLPLLPPDAYPEGSATFVREGRFFVTRAKEELFAVSQKCPHLGCAVPFCEASGKFECPCHGSVYNLAGEWISGPAPRGMDKHPLQVVDGRVVVNTAILEQGAPLGSRLYDTPDRGGSCAPDAEG
jgi:nitrite reductase/ring-hydroxylating ferredoxin subunit